MSATPGSRAYRGNWTERTIPTQRFLTALENWSEIKTLVDTMNKLIGKLDALVERLDEIQEQPGRRLRDIKDKVIVGVATSLGTALVIALLVLAVNNL